MPIMVLFLAGSLVVLGALIALIKYVNRMRQRALATGYASLGQYLASTPRSDAEKRDAVDLCLKGLVLCLLGLVFPPFLLIGCIPLFYGARKLAYSAMGFGLFDDGDSQEH